MLFFFFAEGLSLACFVKAKGAVSGAKIAGQRGGLVAAGEKKREACLGWLIQGKREWPREGGRWRALSLRWWFLLFLSLDQLGEESGRCYESWF